MLETSTYQRAAAWSRVILICAAGFIFNTTEYMPIGIMSKISSSFRLNDTEAGMLMTFYAWIVAVVSLPIMLMTSKVNRRILLIAVMSLFTVSHFISFFSWSFDTLIVSRICVAFCHALFWSISVSMAVNFAPPGKKSKALSLLATATGLAAVVGLPLGRMLGEYAGWRMTFLMIGIISAAILILIIRNIPATNNKNTGSFNSLPLLIKRPSVLVIEMFTVLIITAHFTLYTYIEPLMKNQGGLDEQLITFVLFMMGGAGMFGSVIFTHGADRSVSGTLYSASLLFLTCLLILSIFPLSIWVIIPACLLWSLSFIIIGMILQLKMLDAANDATDVGMSIHSALVNLGIGTGAFLGNKLSHKIGIESLGYVSAGFAALGFLVTIVSFGHFRVIVYRFTLRIKNISLNRGE